MKTADVHNKDLTGKVKIFGGREYGKELASVAAFLSEGKAGKSAIYATASGNFLSPKAVEQKIDAERKRIFEALKGLDWEKIWETQHGFMDADTPAEIMGEHVRDLILSALESALKEKV